MRTIFAALALMATAAGPVMAQTYDTGGRTIPPGHAMQDDAYGAYAYAPGSYGPAWGSGVVFEGGRYAGADPDPAVRAQLEQQADINFNR